MKRPNPSSSAHFFLRSIRASLICGGLVVCFLSLPNSAKAQFERIPDAPMAPLPAGNLGGNAANGPRQAGANPAGGQQGQGQQGGKQMVQQMMNRFDKDGDQKLDMNELGQFMQFIQQRHQSMQQNGQGQRAGQTDQGRGGQSNSGVRNRQSGTRGSGGIQQRGQDADGRKTGRGGPGGGKGGQRGGGGRK